MPLPWMNFIKMSRRPPEPKSPPAPPKSDEILKMELQNEIYARAIDAVRYGEKFQVLEARNTDHQAFIVHKMELLSALQRRVEAVVEKNFETFKTLLKKNIIKRKDFVVLPEESNTRTITEHLTAMKATPREIEGMLALFDHAIHFTLPDMVQQEQFRLIRERANGGTQR